MFSLLNKRGDFLAQPEVFETSKLMVIELLTEVWMLDSSSEEPEQAFIEPTSLLMNAIFQNENT